jgi:hypothetical protein
MAKKPEDRYQSMEEFAQAMERLPQHPTAPAVLGETLLAPSLPVPKEKKGTTLPLVGTLLGLVTLLIVMALLLLCVVGVALNFNLFNPDSPTPVVSITGQPQTTQSKGTMPSKTTPGSATEVDILAQRNGSIKAGEKVDLGSVTTAAGIKYLIVQVNPMEGTVDLVIIKPDGSILNTTDNQHDVMITTMANMKMYTLTNPPGGKWSFRLQNAKPDKESMVYTFFVSTSK